MSKLTKFKKGLIVGVSYVSGWAAVRISFKTMADLSQFIFDQFKRKKPKYPNDTFTAACRRHAVGPEELLKIQRQFLNRKRLYLVVTAVCFVMAIRGAMLLSINTFGMSSLAGAFSLVLVFNSALREWQCSNKTLCTTKEFFDRGGLMIMLNFCE